MEIQKLKQLLGIETKDDSKDLAIGFVLLEVEESIKNYCNISEIPSGLENTAYHMAIEVYRRTNPGQEEEVHSVSSIKEGDTSISFNGNGKENITGSVTERHKASLNRFRRVRFS